MRKRSPPPLRCKREMTKLYVCIKNDPSFLLPLLEDLVPRFPLIVDSVMVQYRSEHVFDVEIVAAVVAAGVGLDQVPFSPDTKSILDPYTPLLPQEQHNEPHLSTFPPDSQKKSHNDLLLPHNVQFRLGTFCLLLQQW